MARKKRLGEALIEAHIISQEQLEDALRVQQENSKLLGQILSDMGWVTEEEVYYAMSKVLNVDYVNPDDAMISKEAIRLVPPLFALEHNVLPLHIESGKILHLAMENPMELNVIQQIEFKTGMRLKLSIAPPERLRKVVQKYYTPPAPQVAQEQPVTLLQEGPKPEPTKEAMKPEQPVTWPKEGIKREPTTAAVHEESRPGDKTGAAGGLEGAFAIIQEIQQSRKGNQVIPLVDLLLTESVRKRASDISFEPSQEHLHMRLKIEGAVYEAIQLPKWIQLPVFSRIKVLANMNISDSQASQHGHASIVYNERKIYLRISTGRTTYGDKMDIRILDSQIAFQDTVHLGLSPDYVELFRTKIQEPRGWIVVAGPGSSGRTTTLYALLNATKNFIKNVITIEDPIEYQFHGITQCQVNPKIGLTYASGLRSILRQNPPIVLVGEIRDVEVAAAAMGASEAGHLVLSTFQADHALAVVERLGSMGISANRVASNLLMVIAQRLVRKICPDCKTQYTPGVDELRSIGLQSQQAPAFMAYKGRGCQTCNHTGYYAQIAIYEIFVLTDQVRAALMQQGDIHVLKNLGTKAGLKTFLRDGIEKIYQGLTTIEEVAKIYHVKPAAVKPPVQVEPAKIPVQPQEMCTQCGKKLDKEWLFCPFCGTKRPGASKDIVPPAVQKP